jgi:hypothetical protein
MVPYLRRSKNDPPNLGWLGLAEGPAVSREADRAIAAIIMLDAYRQENGHDFTTQRFG